MDHLNHTVPKRFPGPVAATLLGAVIWAFLLGVVGGITNRAELGAWAGGMIGAFIGFGYAKKWIGPVVFWMTVFAVVGSILGPACDADALSSALVSSGIGAFVGATGWRGVLILLGGLIGVNIGGGFFGLGIGLIFAWFISYRAFAKIPTSEWIADSDETRPHRSESSKPRTRTVV